MAFIYDGMSDDPMILRDADGKPFGIQGAIGPVGMSDADRFDPEEAKRRFEATLRAALTTPHTPLKDKPKVRPRKAADPGRDRAAPSSDGGPSASSAPRGARGRP